MAYISFIKLINSYKDLVKSLHFIKYIYWRFRSLYLILLILLIKYLFLLSTLTSGGGSYIYLSKASNIGVIKRKINI